MAETYTGGCFCGAVRFAVTGTPLNVRICHCRICQKTTGGPFFARAMFDRAGFEVTGELGRIPSSHRMQRAHCLHCGTPLFAEPLDTPTEVSINLVTLDKPDALKPQVHVWTSSKLSWLVLADGLPQHPEGAPG